MHHADDKKRFMEGRTQNRQKDIRTGWGTLSG